jgi:hypothetical protein
MAHPTMSHLTRSAHLVLAVTVPPRLMPLDHPPTAPPAVSPPAPTASRCPCPPTALTPYHLRAVALSRRESPFASLLLTIELSPLCSECHCHAAAPRAPKSSSALSRSLRVFPIGQAASPTNGLSSHSRSCWKSVAHRHVRGTCRCPVPLATSKRHRHLLEFSIGTAWLTNPTAACPDSTSMLSPAMPCVHSLPLRRLSHGESWYLSTPAIASPPRRGAARCLPHQPHHWRG